MSNARETRLTPDEYLAIERDRPAVERFTREQESPERPEPRWVRRDTSGLESVVHLVAIEADLALREVYDKVELGPLS